MSDAESRVPAVLRSDDSTETPMSRSMRTDGTVPSAKGDGLARPRGHGARSGRASASTTSA